MIDRGAVPHVEASMVKVWLSELRQHIALDALAVIGAPAQVRLGAAGAPADGIFERLWRASTVLKFAGAPTRCNGTSSPGGASGCPGDTGRTSDLDLDLDETQRALADSARRLLARGASVPARQAAEASAAGFDEALWRQAIELGWTGLTAPEDLGGGGGDLLGAAVVAVELGRAAVALPFQACVGAAVVAGRLGASPAADDVVRAVAAGTRASLAAPAGAFPEARLRGPRLTGGPWIVEWAAAELVVIPAVDEAGSTRLVAAPAGALDVTPVASTDNERIAFVTAGTGAVTDLAPRGVRREALAEALAATRLLRAASLVGTVERVLELTVAHVAAAREQFGQPLGRFQVVQHKCADMAIAADAARLAVLHALSRTVDGAQLHGGLGFMSEYELPYHFRRAKAARQRDGGECEQLERIATHLDELMASGWDRT